MDICQIWYCSLIRWEGKEAVPDTACASGNENDLVLERLRHGVENGCSVLLKEGNLGGLNLKHECCSIC